MHTIDLTKVWMTTNVSAIRTHVLCDSQSVHCREDRVRVARHRLGRPRDRTASEKLAAPEFVNGLLTAEAAILSMVIALVLGHVVLLPVTIWSF